MVVHAWSSWHPFTRSTLTCAPPRCAERNLALEWPGGGGCGGGGGTGCEWKLCGHHMVGKWTALVWSRMHGVHGTLSLDLHSRARHRTVQNAISLGSGLEVMAAVAVNVSGSYLCGHHMVGKWTALVWLCMHGVHGTLPLDVHSRARHRAVQNAISHWSGPELVVVVVAVHVAIT